MSGRVTRLQRRNEQREEQQATTRRKRAQIESDEEDVQVIEDESPKPDGSKIWFCQICPMYMSSADQMRVIVPCGHTFCPDCSIGVRYCPLEDCDYKKPIKKISTPKIQQGEEEENLAPTASEVALKEQKELESQLSEMQAKLDKVKQKRRQSEQMFFMEQNRKRKSLGDFEDNKTDLGAKLNETQRIKLPLARFFSTIENAPIIPLDVNNFRPCPTGKVINGVCEYELARSIYTRAAHLLSNEIKHEKSRLESESKPENFNCAEDMSQNELLETSINELVSNLQHTKDKPGLLKYFEKLSSSAPSRASLNSSLGSTL